ncbi:hypothetical protein BON30_17415 [Cystobacter ferrugineus]|uniref:Tetracycline repressor TetR C-terminal domain-containing protein n=1 Tax=Cystobacter ferrugineus TaxID=83449 RepID=A0A1L9BAP5_9BACT|nr:TetR/AcrR family transcriptional regulator C-terminal domain-containing protein [Cystobacter ferrugineus]OJH39298.1 hypothetical protein BON30_17415 [Cystobacter ferrugineus]
MSTIGAHQVPGPDPLGCTPLPPEPAKGYDVEQRAQRIDGERLPLARAAGEELFTGFDDRFERGLRLILRGIGASLPASS